MKSPAGKPADSPARKAAKSLARKPAKPPVKKSAKSARFNPLAPARISELFKRLDAAYPEPRCALIHSNAWELTVATILSAQCTDVRVNMVTPGLFAKYSNAAAFARIEPEHLEPEIRSTGFFRNKAKSIVGAARKVMQEFGGKVPETMEEILTLPGVARKTANVVLGSWYGKAEGVVVDTHVFRLSRRLELTRNATAEKVEQDLMKVVPRDRWIDFSHQLIWHGRKVCFARKPACAQCPLENICHAADKTWSTVDIHRNARP